MVGGWAVALGGRLLGIGYRDNRLVLLACPRGLALHGATQPPELLRELRQVDGAALNPLEGVVVGVRAGPSPVTKAPVSNPKGTQGGLLRPLS